MGISKELKVPTIDFCNPELKPGTPQWESTKTQVLQALQEYGIFEAVYDKVPREGIFDTSKEIFEFPLETKLKTKSTIPMHGYLGQYPMLPAYESLGIADVLKSESVDSIANIFWPDGNPDFGNVLQTFSKPLVELDEMIKKMILESLGLKNHIDEFLESYFYNFRFTHYNPGQVKGEEGNIPGLSIHTDSGFLTFILQNSVNGLEVQTKNGEWIDVNIAPNSLVVIVGDSFMTVFTCSLMRASPEGETPHLHQRPLSQVRCKSRDMCEWQLCKGEDQRDTNAATTFAIFQQGIVTTRIQTRDVGMVVPQSPCHLPTHLCPWRPVFTCSILMYYRLH